MTDEEKAQAYYEAGLRKDWREHEEALDHFREAARLGHPGAQYAAAFHLLMGPSAPFLEEIPVGILDRLRNRDLHGTYEEAFRLAEQAGRKGVKHAQMLTGHLHHHGIGTEPDLAQAWQWFTLCALHEDERAPSHHAFHDLRILLSEEQIEEYNEIARRNPIGREAIKADAKTRKQGFELHEAAVQRKKRIGGGTGFLINREGHYLTCEHVVRDTEHISIGLNRKAQLIGSDYATDIAILKVEPGAWEAQTEPAKLRNPGPILGEEIHGIGYTEMQHAYQSQRYVQSCCTRGYVNALFQPGMQAWAFGFDAKIHPGFSGSPITDRGGRVIGMGMASRPDKKSIGNFHQASRVEALRKILQKHDTPFEEEKHDPARPDHTFKTAQMGKASVCPSTFAELILAWRDQEKNT